jgi:ectoine hydroxylase-related dioxygenase (phytanoyl-CoA dioxygenase family)
MTQECAPGLCGHRHMRRDYVRQRADAGRRDVHDSDMSALPIPLVGARTLPVAAPLSCDAVQRFHDDGFLVVSEPCDHEELKGIRALLYTLFESRAGRNEGNQLDMLSLDRQTGENLQPQILKPSLYAPVLLRTQHFARAQAMARQLLGADARFGFDHAILKPAGKVAATPWHQDDAHGFDPDFHYEQLSIWMPLQDVSEENGCMQYMPGSHRGPLLPHRSPGDDARIHALECEPGSFDESAAAAQPVPAGACILHAGRTVHAALPNRSAADRLAYVIVFRAPPVARAAPVHFAWLESKRTASLERSRHWRQRGGFLVLLVRWLRRTLSSDLHVLNLKARGVLLRTRLRLRSGQPRPRSR